MINYPQKQLIKKFKVNCQNLINSRSLPILVVNYFKTTHKWPQWLRNDDGSILLLVIFEQADEHSWNGTRCSIECVHKLGHTRTAFSLLRWGGWSWTIADAQSPALIVGTVRGA